jgi:hypothetical protein
MIVLREGQEIFSISQSLHLAVGASHWVPGVLSVEGKQLGQDGDSSLLSSDKVRNEWNFICTSLYNIMLCMGTALPVALLAALCLTESVQF